MPPKKRHGGWRGPSNGSSQPLPDRTKSSQPCHLISKTGKCKFGDTCKFSHGTSSHQATPASRNACTATQEQSQDKQSYDDWRYLLRGKNQSLTAYGLAEFWSGALRILDSNDREWHQRLAKDLMSDDFNGLNYIKSTMDLKPSTRIDHSSQVVDSFLRVITHHSIIDCMSIQTPVGTMYNFIAGVNGNRAVTFFHGVCGAIQSACGEAPETCDRRLRLTVEALYELLCRERRALLHKQLPSLIDLIRNCFATLQGVAVPSQDLRTTPDRIDMVDRMVKIAQGNLVQPKDVSDVSNGAANGIAAAYPVEIPVPGDRHDNDFPDIAKVSVLPSSEELLCDIPEYLPSTDIRRAHFEADPSKRYLDTHFRLLRYDLFGPLKDAVMSVVSSLEKGKLAGKVRGDINAHIYTDASVLHITVDRRRGFQAQISFKGPPQMGKKAQDRQRWWENSRRLEEGSLVCLVCPQNGKFMPLLLIITNKCTDTSKSFNLVSDEHHAIVTSKLARTKLPDLQLLNDLYKRNVHGVLVEVPGIIPATFEPILRNLQMTSIVGSLPFQQWIVPDPSALECDGPTLQPPRYARGANFTFPLDSLISDGGSLSVPATASPEDSELVAGIVEKTGLDDGQARALIAAFTREYAQIQGPPGTGKSYLGVKLIQVLLGLKKEANLGPIIIICYTNHALDQFAKHLLAVGIDKILRIGGQSRSPELEKFNLREVAREFPKTGNERWIEGSTYGAIDTKIATIGHRLGPLHKLRSRSWSAVLEAFLKKKHPNIYHQLWVAEEDGFKGVGKDFVLTTWLGQGPKKLHGKLMSSVVLDEERVIPMLGKAEEDVRGLSASERIELTKYWLQQAEQQETERLFSDIEDLDKLNLQKRTVYDEINRKVLLTADIICVTTTGMARDIETLRGLRSKVIVCEEAAEVLEAHMISALMPGVEHFIQIGDHQQLRPQINNYNLSLESVRGKAYQLDRSQFERLATGEAGIPRMPIAQLNVQRRMRPQISSLVRNTLYPGLNDHTTVETLPDVVGIRENVFWLSHDYEEDSSAQDGRHKSHSNAWEVSMTKALVRHIVRQGVYKSTDIAVLTPYTGQLQKLRAAFSEHYEVYLGDRDEEILSREFDAQEEGQDTRHGPQLHRSELTKSLRLATVDNFQGEEAKVVIISLVRGNKERKAGFLRTENRINVLLSRAQHGMYLIGNSDTYASIPMWADVLKQLSEAGSLGTTFNLSCPRHPDTVTQCAEPEDFEKRSPEGGCRRLCDKRLAGCGHRCQALCHSDAMHLAFVCPQQCPRLRSTCSHPCPKLCGEECGPCRVPVDEVPLPCGHLASRVPCHETKEVDKIRCATKVSKVVHGCEHTAEVLCPVDVGDKDYCCRTPCEAILECGHPCKSTCGRCKKKGSHAACEKTCARPRNTCGHLCGATCHVGTPCPPCNRPCEVRCAHSRCALKCPEACAPCIEKCTWHCEHQGTCSMPCAAPCDRLPCNERCTKKLSCGHQCPSICGEMCPEGYCQTCGSRGEQRVDFLELKLYKEINLDESPIVVLSCGHFFTAESLDGTVHMSEVYTSDEMGNFTGLTEPSEVITVPSCPDCKLPIRQFTTQRYNRVVNMAVMDETSRKLLIGGQSSLQTLNERIEQEEAALQASLPQAVIGMRAAMVASRNGLKNKGPTWYFKTRYKMCNKLQDEAEKLRKKASAGNQPAKRLVDATMHTKSQREEEPGPRLNGPVKNKIKFDKRVYLGAWLAQISVEDVAARDQLAILSKWEATDPWPLNPKPDTLAVKVLEACYKVMMEAYLDGLPRTFIQGTLLYARLAKCLQSCGPRHGTETSDFVQKAGNLLGMAHRECRTQFEGVDDLRKRVEEMQEMLRRDQPLTAAELESIKLAMVAGPQGIHTHSGHWYKCSKGHVFAIGECGAPMEEAVCPECGARIGGRNHRMVEGMSRATEMED